jgi:hypothetical protein
MLSEEYEDLIKADGLDEAIIGVVERMGTQAICYDTEKVIEILMRDMTEDEAWEYFHYNIAGAWVGDHTPFFLTRESMNEEK